MLGIARESHDDVALLVLVRAVVARDRQRISELLATTPSLAGQTFAAGASHPSALLTISKTSSTTFMKGIPRCTFPRPRTMARWPRR
jgi:hypothetical protein